MAGRSLTAVPIGKGASMHAEQAIRTHLGLAVIGIALLASACSVASPPVTGTPTASSSPSVAPSPSASASLGTGPLTDAEIATLTGGARVPIPAAAPAPAITAAAAEAIVRTRYTGQRTTIGVVRIAMNLPSGLRTGWFVALTPADGEACNLHAGLLPRAIEGGVVADQGTGDYFWTFVCGP